MAKHDSMFQNPPAPKSEKKVYYANPPLFGVVRLELIQMIQEAYALGTDGNKLMELAAKPYLAIKLGVAGHPNASEATLRFLADEKDRDYLDIFYMEKRLLRSPKRVQRSSYDVGKEVLNAIMKNPHSPLGLVLEVDKRLHSNGLADGYLDEMLSRRTDLPQAMYFEIAARWNSAYASDHGGVPIHQNLCNNPAVPRDLKARSSLIVIMKHLETIQLDERGVKEMLYLEHLPQANKSKVAIVRNRHLALLNGVGHTEEGMELLGRMEEAYEIGKHERYRQIAHDRRMAIKRELAQKKQQEELQALRAEREAASKAARVEWMRKQNEDRRQRVLEEKTRGPW